MGKTWVPEWLLLWRFTCSREIVSTVTEHNPRNPRESLTCVRFSTRKVTQFVWRLSGVTPKLFVRPALGKGKQKVPVLMPTALKEVLPDQWSCNLLDPCTQQLWENMFFLSTAGFLTTVGFLCCHLQCCSGSSVQWFVCRSM